MPDRTRVKDNSSLHKCRIELPNLIDDMGLDVYTFRLYVHLKRVAGEDGSCFQSMRTLAAICGMSQGKVAEAKDELERRNLITRQTKPTRGGHVDEVTIADLWPENFRKYAPGSDPQNESVHVVSTSTSKRSRGEHFDESVHVVSTSAESAQVVNALTSKRTPHESEEDSDHGVVGVGVGRTLAFLIDKGISAAEEFAHLPYEPMYADYEARTADGQTKANIVKAWRLRPPTETYHYEQPNGRPDRPEPAPRATERPAAARGKHGPTGGSDIHDPGWRERLIADAERRAQENGITE